MRIIKNITSLNYEKESLIIEKDVLKNLNYQIHLINLILFLWIRPIKKKI